MFAAFSAIVVIAIVIWYVRQDDHQKTIGDVAIKTANTVTKVGDVKDSTVAVASDATAAVATAAILAAGNIKTEVRASNHALRDAGAAFWSTYKGQRKLALNKKATAQDNE